jgi:hypothetical protein
LDSNSENLPGPKRRKPIFIPTDCFISNSGFNGLVSSGENRVFNPNIINAVNDSWKQGRGLLMRDLGIQYERLSVGPIDFYDLSKLKYRFWCQINLHSKLEITSNYLKDITIDGKVHVNDCAFLIATVNLGQVYDITASMHKYISIQYNNVYASMNLYQLIMASGDTVDTKTVKNLTSFDMAGYDRRKDQFKLCRIYYGIDLVVDKDIKVEELLRECENMDNIRNSILFHLGGTNGNKTINVKHTLDNNLNFVNINDFLDCIGSNYNNEKAIKEVIRDINLAINKVDEFANCGIKIITEVNKIDGGKFNDLDINKYNEIREKNNKRLELIDNRRKTMKNILKGRQLYLIQNLGGERLFKGDEADKSQYNHMFLSRIDQKNN